MATSNNIAESTKLCGRSGSLTRSECETALYEPPYSKDLPYKDWDNNTDIKMKICDKKLYSTYNGLENYPNNCTAIQDIEFFSTKKKLTPKERENFIRSNPWILQCLNKGE